MTPRSFLIDSVFGFMAFCAVACWGQGPSLTSRELWKPEHVPFSFRYDGQESEQLLPAWQTSRVQMADGTVRYSFLDPKTKLKVTAEVRYFRDYPGAVDWVIRLRNEGSSDTPIIEDILPLHRAVTASPGDCIIRHARGSDATAQDLNR
jgi:hypothetical protein